MLVLLAPAGTLAAHGLAYGWQGGGDGLHDYLHVVVGLPFVVLLIVCWVVAGPRARTTALPSVRALVAAQLGFYTAQETLERAAHNDSFHDLASQLVSSPAVRAGAGLQVVVGIAGLAGLRLARGAVGRVTTFDWRGQVVTTRLLTPALAVVPIGAVASTVHVGRTNPSRAPPFDFVH